MIWAIQTFLPQLNEIAWTMSYNANEMAEERNTMWEQWGLFYVVLEAHHTGCNDIDCCKIS